MLLASLVVWNAPRNEEGWNAGYQGGPWERACSLGVAGRWGCPYEVPHVRMVLAAHKALGHLCPALQALPIGWQAPGDCGRSLLGSIPIAVYQLRS